jgi:hypothetical protein
MNPKAELERLISRLREDLHCIPECHANRLRISDRARELARCLTVLARLEKQDTVTFKAHSVEPPLRDRWGWYNRDGTPAEFPHPGIEPTDRPTIDELRAHEKPMDRLFTLATHGKGKEVEP